MKFRTDFVTNSSSSSFISIGIYDTELSSYLQSLVDAGKAIKAVQHDNYGELYGEEACSYLYLDEKRVEITQQLGGAFCPQTDGWLKILDMDQYGETYSEKSQQTDAKKVMKYPWQNAEMALAVFFKSLSREQKEEMIKRIKKASEEKNIGCLPFIGNTVDSVQPDYFSEIEMQIRKSKEQEKRVREINNLEKVGNQLEGKVCCLTGDFAYGSKEAVESFIVSLGGTCSSSVTKKTNMLIVGSLGSAAYSHGSYGSKYIKAKQMQDAGEDMTILKEKYFFAKYKKFAQ